MLLTARMLVDVASVNSFDTVDTVEMTEGDSGTVYLQLVDGSVDKQHSPRGRRYCPAQGATLAVTLQTLDSAKRVTVNATPAFGQVDRSIWKFTLPAAVPGTFALKLALNEGASQSAGFVGQALSVRSVTPEF